ncbi:MAG TPA: TIR domain-containing protein [Methanobacteriaceae archaeon]|nr:TIR domain-containing protein [Methanobacteriaceae archaeon]
MMFEEEMDLKTYQLFITRVSETDEEYGRFTGRLNDTYDFNYENHSNNVLSGKSDKEELKNALKDTINKVEMVIILAGLYPTYSNMIMAVLELAQALEKPVLLIRPYGMEDVPKELEEASNGVIGWSASCIAGAIKGVLNDDEDEYCEF